MDVVIAELGAAHHGYLREQLAQHEAGGRLLGRLLSTVDLSGGRLWAFVPAERADEAVADLEAGVIRSQHERERLASVVASHVMQLLRSRAPGLVMFEHWCGLEAAAPSPTRAFTVGDSVFDYVRDDEQDDRLARLLLASLWFPTVGIATELPETMGLRPSSELTPSEVGDLVSRLGLVLVGAWDADAYVLWEPRVRTEAQ